MILWTVKLIGMIRRAIAGRKYPYQLAWAVAFGLLLGIVPHGNLLAICLLVVVVSLRLNHAMAALTAIGASFLATKLDPVSHAVGEYLLTQPKFASFAETAWALPMMPWTDLNNTVVLGSLTIGLAALLPVFMITYPVFRFLAPATAKDEQGDELTKASKPNKTTIVDRGSQRVPPPKRDPARQPSVTQAHSSQAHSPQPHPASEPIQFVEVQPAHTAPPQNHDAVETRIDVIRIKDHAAESTSKSTSESTSGQTAGSGQFDLESPNPNQPMDEALNYLLRQLRDSQSRNAA